MTEGKLKAMGFTPYELEDIQEGMEELNLDLEDIKDIEIFESKEEFCINYIKNYYNYEEFLLNYLDYEKLFEIFKDNTYEGDSCIIDFEL